MGHTHTPPNPWDIDIGSLSPRSSPFGLQDVNHRDELLRDAMLQSDHRNQVHRLHDPEKNTN